MISKIYNAITWIIAIVGIIANIILFGLMHSLAVALYGIISVVILCLIFGGISSILGYLEELGAGQKKADTSEVDSNIISNIKVSDNKWECPKCHTVNEYSDNPGCSNCHWTP